MTQREAPPKELSQKWQKNGDLEYVYPGELCEGHGCTQGGKGRQGIEEVKRKKLHQLFLEWSSLATETTRIPSGQRWIDSYSVDVSTGRGKILCARLLPWQSVEMDFVTRRLCLCVFPLRLPGSAVPGCGSREQPLSNIKPAGVLILGIQAPWMCENTFLVFIGYPSQGISLSQYTQRAAQKRHSLLILLAYVKSFSCSQGVKN